MKTPNQNSKHVKLTNMLKKLRIIGNSETYENMKDRVFSIVTSEEIKYGSSKQQIQEYKQKMMNRLESQEFVPSSIILTNAGRYEDKPLAACSVPPINLKEDYSKIKQIVDIYHEKGMGTGFNFDETEDPVEMLEFLNDIAIEGQNNGLQDRPVGNMGIISSDHPKIYNLIKYKDGKNKNREWIFNISVNLKEDFMAALQNGEDYRLKDGTIINPNDLFNEISKSACSCGDPGIFFMKRFNQDNPAPKLGEYKSLAPCGEVALAEGETCQFSYINISKFVKNKKIDYDSLKDVIYDGVRFLDDTLDISISRYGNRKSENIMNQKRKIGLGICGLADVFIKCGIPYDSEEALDLSADLMSFITYNSKKASIKLGKERGIAPAFEKSKLKQDFIEKKYGKYATNTVGKQDWKNLSEEIKAKGIRNMITTILPPTGRSSMIIYASPAIEPIFSLELNDEMRRDLMNKLKKRGLPFENLPTTINKKDLPSDLKEIYKTCLEIDPISQIKICSALQKFTDGAISKTININSTSTPNDIRKIYLQAYEMGLKGITIYRDGSKNLQPMKLQKGGKMEIELRAFVKDFDPVKNCLKEIGAHKTDETEIEDIWICDKNITNYEDAKMNKVGSYGLRFRIQKGRANEICIKTIINEKDHQIFSEYETSFDDLEQMKNIFKILGFKIFCVLKKKRETYSFKNMKINLEDIEGFKSCIEIEILGEDNFEEKKKKLHEIMDILKINKEDRINTSITSLFMEENSFK